MLDKAVVIASEALQYLQTRFPSDSEKYKEFHVACGDMVLRLSWLNKELRQVEHEQKSKSSDPCNCSTCNEFSKEDRKHLEGCLREAVREDISGVSPESQVVTKGNPAGKLVKVYDAQADMMTTNDITEVTLDVVSDHTGDHIRPKVD